MGVGNGSNEIQAEMIYCVYLRRLAAGAWFHATRCVYIVHRMLTTVPLCQQRENNPDPSSCTCITESTSEYTWAGRAVRGMTELFDVMQGSELISVSVKEAA